MSRCTYSATLNFRPGVSCSTIIFWYVSYHEVLYFMDVIVTSINTC